MVSSSLASDLHEEHFLTLCFIQKCSTFPDIALHYIHLADAFVQSETRCVAHRSAKLCWECSLPLSLRLKCQCKQPFFCLAGCVKLRNCYKTRNDVHYSSFVMFSGSESRSCALSLTLPKQRVDCA